MEKKLNKAQVSIFIIIGIVLVIVTTFLIYNSEFEIFVSHDTKLKNQISEIVEDCIYDSANTGTFILGQQGGYIEIPDQVKANPEKYIDFGSKIPTWDSTTGDYPSIASMERELKNYVEKKSLSCIQNNLKAMEDVFDINLTGDKFEVVPTINDNNVIIEATYPITFNEKNSDEILNVEDYVVNLENLRLGDLYNLAVSIYNTEAKTNIFEELTLDQIHSDNDYSSPLSMPSEGMQISCGKRVWTYPQLKKNLANMNNNNFKYLQFEGTYSKDSTLEANLGYNEQTQSYKDYFEKIYTVDLVDTKLSFKNYDVNVYMPSTEINNQDGYLRKYPFRTFEVSPSDGQTTQSMDLDIELGTEIPIPCIQVYHHIYTLDYDLVIKLEDKSEDGNFVFQFPSRVEIYNNQAKEKPTQLITTESKTFNKESYCNNNSYQYPLMIVTTDIDGNPISNVNISYKCINIQCDMGTTQKPTFRNVTRKYADPQLVTDFPFCIGGYVIGEKEGYFTTKQRVETDEDLLRRETFVGDNLIELKMTPVKSFEINSAENFLVIQKEDGTGKRVLTEDDGTIFVEISNEEKDFKSTAIWPNDNEILNKLDFLDEDDMKYNVTVYYMDSESNLKGMLELTDWKPNIHSGNNIIFTIPGTSQIVDEDSYVEFYDYVLTASKKYEPVIY